jgi:hypothetical protein
MGVRVAGVLATFGFCIGCSSAHSANDGGNTPLDGGSTVPTAYIVQGFATLSLSAAETSTGQYGSIVYLYSGGGPVTQGFASLVSLWPAAYPPTPLPYVGGGGWQLPSAVDAGIPDSVRLVVEADAGPTDVTVPMVALPPIAWSYDAGASDGGEVVVTVSGTDCDFCKAVIDSSAGQPTLFTPDGGTALVSLATAGLSPGIHTVVLTAERTNILGATNSKVVTHVDRSFEITTP